LRALERIGAAIVIGSGVIGYEGMAKMAFLKMTAFDFHAG